MSEKYKSLKVKELQELLQKTGLPHTGKKEELIGRLVKHDETKALELESLEAEFGNLDDFDEAKLNLDELADPDLKSFQPEDEEKPLESILASNATNTIPTNSSTTTSQEPITKEGSGFKFEPIVFDKKTAASSTSGGAPVQTFTTKDKTATEAERKLERAKRFGVQVDEKTKQEIRAARFGSNKPSSISPRQAPVKTSPTSKGIDPEVLRKRAERFGLPHKTTKSSKTTTTLSPEEEEKKRKRAERFGGDANKKMKK